MVLQASFTDLLRHRSRKYIDHSTLPGMVAAVSLILAVDAERMLRRAIDQDMPVKVTVQIVAGDLPDDMRHYFIEEVVDNLAKRTVAIEPTGVPPSVTVELT